jgi:hypothetical protein
MEWRSFLIKTDEDNGGITDDYVGHGGRLKPN